MTRTALKIFLPLILLFSCYRVNQTNIAQVTQKSVPNYQQKRRVPNIDYPGKCFKIFLPPVDSTEIFLPASFTDTDSLVLLIHFHGASFIGKYSVSRAEMPSVLVNINLGQGSSTYERPFLGKNKFPEMLTKIKEETSSLLGHPLVFSRVILSSFSAGYGSIRTILRSKENIKLIDAIILLDGMHTDYDSTNSSGLNIDKLNMYLPFAQQAIDGKKLMVITHSEIAPGTYASNRETSDYLIKKLDLTRKKN